MRVRHAAGRTIFCPCLRKMSLDIGRARAIGNRHSYNSFDAISIHPIEEAHSMRKLVAALIVVALIVGAAVIQSYSHAGGKTPDNIGHMVYFKLKDGSAKANGELLESCENSLRRHGGTIS